MNSFDAMRSPPGSARAPGLTSEKADDPVAPGESTVLILAPSALQRECLAYVLHANAPRIAVETGADLADVPHVTPDLILLDTTRPERDPTEVGQLIADCRQQFGVKPIMLIADAGPKGQLVFEQNQDQLEGCMPTNSALDVVLAAIRLVLVGGTFIPKDMLRPKSAIGALLPDAARDLDPDRETHLTTRERDIVRLLRDGKQNKVIAYELKISESTVKVHIRNIMKKSRARNRTQIALRMLHLDEVVESDHDRAVLEDAERRERSGVLTRSTREADRATTLVS